MEKLKKINQYWKEIAGAIAIVTFIWGIFSYLQEFKDDSRQILSELNTTKQMALKSVIWNDEIPLTERAAACDAYLSAGYNSMTKKECEVIINKGVNDGIFSYAEREVNKDE